MKGLEPGLWDIRPETVLIDRETRKCSLETREQPDPDYLRGSNKKAAFLSNNALEEGAWIEKDAVW